MNYVKYYRRHKIKVFIICAFILGFALVSTYLIYDKFSKTNDHIYRDENLKITFHEKTENRVTIDKITPVTDAVGRASDPYSFTLENHTDHTVRYMVSIEKDDEKITECGCIDNGIPYSLIKVAVNTSKTKIEPRLFSNIPNQMVYQATLKQGEMEDISLRLWIDKDSTDINRDGHFHGLIVVNEQNVMEDESSK